MSNLTSSSISTSDDNFLGFDEDFAAADTETSTDVESTPHVPFIDARRRLESIIDERNLEKDIKEFDFDF